MHFPLLELRGKGCRGEGGVFGARWARVGGFGQAQGGIWEKLLTKPLRSLSDDGFECGSYRLGMGVLWKKLEGEKSIFQSTRNLSEQD